MNKKIFLVAMLAVTMLALSGCFRKSIDSSPPARRVAAQDQPGPAEEPGIISETYTLEDEEQPIIETTTATNTPEVIDESTNVEAADSDDPVEVESAVGDTAHPDIGGDDLEEDPLPDPEPATPEAADQAETVAPDPAAQAAFEPTPDPEDEQVLDLAEGDTTADAPPVTTETGPYYVQVGAFSDLENANKVLAGLLSDGYKGSMLEKTDNGMYRVHAGGFADKDGADAALKTLKTDFPNGFVLKID